MISAQSIEPNMFVERLRREAAHGLHLTRLALNYGEDDPVVQAICGHSLIAAGMRSEGLAAARRARTAAPHGSGRA